ncbi:MAG: alginate export family protein [Tunicatimonas sp.]
MHLLSLTAQRRPPSYLSLLFLLTSAPTVLYAQFTLSGEIRPRTEYRHGFKAPAPSPGAYALFTEQRTRLKLNYQQEKIGVGLTLQDVRIWGATAQINKTDGLTSMHEAWGSLRFSNRWRLKVGRQELVYNDQRLLGSLNWAAQGRSHDAVRLTYQDSTGAFHAGVAMNQSSEVPEPVKLTSTFYQAPGGFAALGGGLPNYKHLQFVWLKKNRGKWTATALLMNTGWQMPDTTVNYLFTGGGNLRYQVSRRTQLKGTGYYQYGKSRIDERVGAYLASFAVEHRWTNKQLTLGGDVLSGTEPGQEQSSTFDPLFGTHHKFYGLMDYFYVGNPHSQQDKSVGLIDLFVKPTFTLAPRASLMVQGHTFFSAVKVLDIENPTGTLPSHLGTEIDLVATYRYVKGVTLKGGYSQMLATPTLQQLKGSGSRLVNHWGWIMLSFTPTFLQTTSTSN